MTSWSTVTQPVGRDVGSAYQAQIPPESLIQWRDVDATEMDLGSGASTSHYTWAILLRMKNDFFPNFLVI